MRHRAEANKAVVVVAPPYERVGSVSEPVAKEYEVQVRDDLLPNLLNIWNLEEYIPEPCRLTTCINLKIRQFEKLNMYLYL